LPRVLGPNDLAALLASCDCDGPVGLRDYAEHVAGPLDHEDEIGDSRRIGGTSGAWAEDDTDLGDHLRRPHIAVEDLTVSIEANHAFLNTCATAVVDADDGYAERHCQVHYFVNLLGGRFAEAPAKDAEILAVHADPSPLYRPMACNDTVGVRARSLEAELVGAMSDEHVQLGEGSRVKQALDAFPSSHLSPGMLACDRLDWAGLQRLLLPICQLGDTLAVYRSPRITSRPPSGVHSILSLNSSAGHPRPATVVRNRNARDG
jgi:hypothetical protein